MIKIIDNTLTALDNCLPSKEKLHNMCEMLFQIGVDRIELSTAAYQKMETLPNKNKYILAINHFDDMSKYPEFHQFLCHHKEKTEKVINHIQLNDIRELPILRSYTDCKEICITGLDDLMCHDYDRLMREIKDMLPYSQIIFNPENTYHCASALAIQWILNKGNDITTSFAACKNNAATEEVLMALRLSIRHKPNSDLSILPELTKLYEEITNRFIGNKKPIIGKDIFKIESGIHADGYHKNPAIYEAYPPVSVGGKAEVVIGKHSGCKAIIYKMLEMNLPVQENDIILLILNRVKTFSIEYGRSLKDEEFRQLAMEVIRSERKQVYR